MKKKSLLITAVAILSFATFTMAQVPSYVPTTGLVGWWPFNGNANDESGNGSNGSLYGPTLSTDRFGVPNKAYDFDGINDYIDIVSTTGLNTNQGISMSLWFNWNGTNGVDNEQYLFLIANNPNGSIIIRDAGTLETYVVNCNCVNDLYCLTNISTNSWNNIVLTYELSQGLMKMYFNGVLIDSTQESMFSYYTTNNPADRFGNYHFNSRYFKGQLDDAGLWNRALDSCEIKDLYFASLGNCCNVSVTTQPINQSVNISTNVQFIAATSDPLATFQWQTDLGVGFQNLSNAGQYSGVTNDTLTVSNSTLTNNNQIFRCIISSGSCTDTSAVAVLTVVNNVGINDFTQDHIFSVYPNPAKSVINIKSAAKLLGSVYAVYDNTGRAVLSGRINSENMVIEVGNLSGGVYLFSVGENQKQTFKIIKE